VDRGSEISETEVEVLSMNVFSVLTSGVIRRPRTSESAVNESKTIDRSN
jgi:hypothetical protein